MSSGQIIDLTNDLKGVQKVVEPQRTKTFGFLGTLNTNVYFKPGDPEEDKYKTYLVQRAGRLFSEDTVRSCLQSKGPLHNPEIYIKTVLERGSKRHQLHLHTNIKVTVPVTDPPVRINYRAFNEKTEEIMELPGCKVLWVNYMDNSTNVEQYITKMSDRF
jgi:hypothetical protein